MQHDDTPVYCLSAALIVTICLIAWCPGNPQFGTLAFGILSGMLAYLQVKPR